MNSLLFGVPSQLNSVYGPLQRERLSRLVPLRVFAGDPSDPRAVREALAPTELIFSTWGMSRMDEAFLDAAPNLKAVFYAAGSVREIVTDAFWERGITLVSAWAANAVPVAEVSASLIILSLKRFFEHARRYKEVRRRFHLAAAGAYTSRVGLIGMGMIGRKVRELLRGVDVRVAAYDPYVSGSEAAELGIDLFGLEEIFSECDVVSLHAPNLPETWRMIRSEHFSSMKDGATFINTARGAIVDESGMIAVLRDRPDITAVLDVTDPEPPEAASPLYTLPNVVLTPHIAGSIGPECFRMADYVIDECERFLSGQALRYQVTRERFERMA